MPEIGFVTAFCPLITTGAGKFVVQIGETRFVVDCNLKPVASVGHVKITFGPEERMESRGLLTGVRERLNTVPESQLPPLYVVP